MSFKNKHLLLSLSLILLPAFNAISQDHNWEKNIPNPVSPKTFEFLKHTEFPVSKYTGLPDISVPIYTISAAGLDLPVSLIYHAGGMRVMEEASAVGLGWRLEAGGRVVQTINGDADSFRGELRVGPGPFLDPADFNIPGGIQDCDAKALAYCKEYGVAIDMSLTDFGPQLIDPLQFSGYQDTQPDIFNFSAYGYSGEFMFDYEQNKFVCLSDKNVSIRSDLPSNSVGNPNRFYITVPDGHTFYFELREITRIEEKYSITTPFNQAAIARDQREFPTSRVFQLIMVYTNKGEEILFGYTDTAEIINYPTVTTSLTHNTLNYPYAPAGSPLHVLAGPKWGNTFYPEYVNSTNFVVTKQSYSYISSIQSDKVLMEFTYSSNRLDQVGAKQLDKISVKDMTSARHQVLSAILDYGYFQGQAIGNTIDPQLVQLEVIKTTDEKLKRLKLKSVSINDEEPYEFIYDESTPLPSKTSLAYDHSGYYNLNHNAQLGGYQTMGISETGTRAAVIKSIQYPTGGMVEFEYEQNGTADPQPVQIPTEMEETTGSIILSDKNFPGAPYVGNIGPSAYHPGGYAVWLNVGYDATIDIRRFLTVAGSCASLNPNNEPYYPNTLWKIQHYNKAAQDLVDSQGWQALTGIVGNTPYFVKEEIGKLLVVQGDTKTWEYPHSTIVLSEGLYWFNVNLNDVCGPQTATGPQGEAFMMVDYTARKALSYHTEMRYPLAPGLRVKKITTKDETGATALVKEYKYFGPKLMSPIVHDYTVPFIFEYEVIRPNSSSPFNDQIDFFRIQGNSHVTDSHSIYDASASASGRYVGYDKVEEYIVDFENSTNNGYIATWYQNEADQQETNIVQMPLVRNDRTNGLVLKEAVYKEGEIEPIQETTTSYNVSQEPCYWNFYSYFDSRFTMMAGAVVSYLNFYKIGFYPIKRTQMLKTGSIVRVREGSQMLVTSELNTYDTHNQLKETTKQNDRGEEVATLIKYPYDLPGNAVCQDMVEENNIASAVDIETRLNGTSIKQYKIDFMQTDIESGFETRRFFDLKQVQTRRNSTESYKTEVDFQIYDEDKVVQVTTSNGIVTTYLWGYNKEYLVAKIIGATYAQSSVLISQSILDNPTNDTALRTHLDLLRQGLPNALVVTYTHQPLVGMSSETDSNGVTRYYDYDEKHRLELIRDNHLNALKFYRYNYFNH